MKGMMPLLAVLCAVSAQAAVVVGSPEVATMDPFCAS